MLRVRLLGRLEVDAGVAGVGGPAVAQFEPGPFTDTYVRMVFPRTGVTYPEHLDMRRIQRPAIPSDWLGRNGLDDTGLGGAVDPFGRRGVGVGRLPEEPDRRERHHGHALPDRGARARRRGAGQGVELGRACEAGRTGGRGAAAMLYLIVKAAISGVIIALASEVARRSPGWAWPRSTRRPERW